MRGSGSYALPHIGFNQGDVLRQWTTLCGCIKKSYFGDSMFATNVKIPSLISSICKAGVFMF